MSTGIFLLGILILRKSYMIQEEEIWEKEGISNVEYDKLTRILKFETIKAKPHAVIQVLPLCFSLAAGLVVYTLALTLV